MEQTYTQAQLVSFGNYLLNAPRLKDFVHPELEEPELIFQVYDADLANWSLENNLPYDVGNEEYLDSLSSDAFNDDQG